MLLVTLSGCFGGKQEERILAQLDLSAEKESIAQGGSNIITVIGKDAKNRTMTVQPTADAWSVEPAEAGNLTPDGSNKSSVVFTAAEGWTGTIKITIDFEGFTAETTFEVSPIVITGAWAYRDIKAQDGPYKTGQQSDLEGVIPVENAPNEGGYMRGYSAQAAFKQWLWGDHWISWDIDVPAPGDYVLVLRYGIPAGTTIDERRVAVAIDGVDVYSKDQPFEFSATGGWGSKPEQWGFAVTDKFTIDKAGTVELKLTLVRDGRKTGVVVAYLALVSPPELEINEEFLLEIEAALGIERDPVFWNPQQ